MTRMITRALAVFAGLALATLSAAAQAPEKKQIKLAVGGKSSLYYLPLTLTEQLGYFKEQGLDVEISDFAGGAKALQALIGGSADVVTGAYEHTIRATLTMAAEMSADEWLRLNLPKMGF